MIIPTQSWNITTDQIFSQENPRLHPLHHRMVEGLEWGLQEVQMASLLRSCSHLVGFVYCFSGQDLRKTCRVIFDNALKNIYANHLKV